MKTYVVTMLTLCSCARSGIGYIDTELQRCAAPCDDQNIDDDVPIIAVEPAYAGLTAWNDYVQPCDDNATCAHAGELRRAAVPGLSSCSSVIAEDEIGAFDWRCDDTSGVVIFSTGLKAGRGLRDLLDPNGFRSNRLLVRHDGELVAASEGAAWWTNTVAPLPANLGSGALVLGDAGTIYIVSASQTTDGYNIDANGIAIVTLADAVLTFSGTDQSGCNGATAEVTSPTDRCLIAAGAQRYLWLEAALDARTAAPRYAALLSDVRHSRVTHSTIRGGVVGGLHLLDVWFTSVTDLGVAETQYGVSLSTSDHNRFSDIRASNGQFNGLSLTDSNDNHFERLRIADYGASGIYLYQSQRNVLTNVVVSNIRAPEGDDGLGINLRNGDSNVLTQVLVTHVEGYGIRINSGSGANTLAHATVIATTLSGVGSIQSGEHTMVDVASLYAGGSAFAFTTAPNNLDGIFADLAGGHAQNAFYLEGADSFRFSGSLWTGGNTGDDCVVNGSTSPGLVTSTCTADGTEGSTTLDGAIFHPGRDYSGAFIGALVSADAVNASDVDGVASHDTLLDWARFESPYRTWGRNEAGVPLGACVSGQTCRIWDWRLTLGNSQLRDVNGTFVPGAVCPVSAQAAIADRADNLFLRHAIELLGDSRGDDDGLCESNEACVYGPNVGVYQGEGELTPPCVFTDGQVSGVELRAYATNGL